MQFLLLFSLTSFLSLFNLDGRREDVQQPQAQKTALGAGAILKLKVFLEGPFINTASSVLMSDNLRTNNGAASNGSQCLIPTTEPYSDLGYTHVVGNPGTIIPSSVFTTTGNDAIVDWVFVELRDPTNVATVKATCSALLQADGDVVSYKSTATPTIQPLTFADAVPAGSYYVVVKHRNHFGIRTNSTVALTNVEASTATVDFTVASPVHGVFGTDARKTLATSGALTMYAGDANRDGGINAADRNLGWRLQNGNAIGGGAFTYLTLTSDFNLSGDVNAVDRNLYWRLNNGLSEQL